MPIGSAIVIATIAACSSQAPEPGEQNLANAMVVNNSIASANSAEPVGTTGTSVGLPDERTPPAEPSSAIDPASAKAAGQVVQQYGALIEQKRFKEAADLWEDPKAADWYARKFGDYREVHLEISKPGNMEGAAGSSYVTVPVSFYGMTSGGAPFKCPGEATLRRVNDVPGSTPRQRHWHIYRLEC